MGEEVVAADFDSDQKPDGAVLLEPRQINAEKVFRIELHLTGRPNAIIDFSSAEIGLAISTLDVNRDGTPDIVIERVFTHKRLKVYLNDGHGAFRNASPEAFPSTDDSAPSLRAPMNIQNLPTLFMPMTRDFELAQVLPARRADDTVRTNFWPEKLIVQCGARAPSRTRAPPSRLSL